MNRAVEELSLFALEKSQQTGQLQVRVAQLEERSHSLERECRTSLDSLKQHEARLTALAAEIEHNQFEEKKLGEQITQAEQREKDLMEQHEAQAGQIGILRTESADLSASVEALEREAAVTAKAVKELKDERAQLGSRVCTSRTGPARPRRKDSGTISCGSSVCGLSGFSSG